MHRPVLSLSSSARNRNLAAGALLGGLAAGLTLSIGGLAFAASNLMLHALQIACVALVVPGVLLAFALGHPPNHLPFWIAALFNFAFWFAFAWAFAFLVSRLRQQFRTLASLLNP